MICWRLFGEAITTRNASSVLGKRTLSKGHLRALVLYFTLSGLHQTSQMKRRLLVGLIVQTCILSFSHMPVIHPNRIDLHCVIHLLINSRQLRQILVRAQLETHQARGAADLHFLITVKNRSVVIPAAERFIGDQTGCQRIGLHHFGRGNRCAFRFRNDFIRSRFAGDQEGGRKCKEEKSIHRMSPW